MANITIEISDKALEIMQKIAEIRKQSLQDYCKGYFKFYEHCAQATPEKLAEYFAKEVKNQKIKEAKEYYAQYKWHRYILKRFDNGKVIEIGWFACPIVINPDCYEPEIKEHIGEYYLEIENGQRKSLGGFNMTNVLSRDYEFYPTLKRLKKGVNRWFNKYEHSDYYKQRDKKETEITQQ